MYCSLNTEIDNNHIPSLVLAYRNRFCSENLDQEQSKTQYSRYHSRYNIELDENKQPQSKIME